METVSRVVCFYLICGLIVSLIQAGTILNRNSDTIEDEKADRLVDFFNKLTSASKLKSPRNMAQQELSRALPRGGGANHKRTFWGWGNLGYCATCRAGTKAIPDLDSTKDKYPGFPVS